VETKRCRNSSETKWMTAAEPSECPLAPKEGAHMVKKQSKTTKAGSPRRAQGAKPLGAKASRSAAPARERTEKTPTTRERDPRLPAVGTTIVRPYKGKEIRVKVLAEGFEYEGTVYRSLSRIGLIVTGYKAISGPHFFFGATVPAPATPRSRKGKEAPAAPSSDAPQPAPASEPATA
jgi:hypothetical protein